MLAIQIFPYTKHLAELLTFTVCWINVSSSSGVHWHWPSLVRFCPIWTLICFLTMTLEACVLLLPFLQDVWSPGFFKGPFTQTFQLTPSPPVCWNCSCKGFHLCLCCWLCRATESEPEGTLETIWLSCLILQAANQVQINWDLRWHS